MLSVHRVCVLWNSSYKKVILYNTVLYMSNICDIVMMTMQSMQMFSYDIQALVCNCLSSGPIGAAAVTYTTQCMRSSYNCTNLANATPRRAQQQQQHATNRRPAITPTIDITSTLTEEKDRVLVREVF